MNRRSYLPIRAMRRRAPNSRGRRILIFVVVTLLLSFSFILSPSSIWSDEGSEQDYRTISAQEVINDDLYLSAETITIDGTVKGDLIAAARVITVNGTVNDDVRMAGQVLTMGNNAHI